MTNKILNSCELLIELAQDNIDAKELNEIIKKYSKVYSNSGQTDYLKNLKVGLETFGNIVAENFLNEITEVKDIKKESVSDSEQKIYTRKQVIFDYDINEGTFRNWQEKGLVTISPSGGRRIYVRKSDLDAFMN